MEAPQVESDGFAMPKFDELPVNGEYAPDPRGIKGDRGLSVEFYKNIDDGLDHIKIRLDKWSTLDDIATPHYQGRFPNQWAAYKTNEDQIQGQVRVEELPGLARETVSMLKARGLQTVEQLAAVPDSTLGRGMVDMRKNAQDYLENHDKASPLVSLKEENEALKARLAKLEAAQRKTKA